MANKPCIGSYICPNCSGKNAVLWNGNRKWICVICKKSFTIHRQKLFNVEYVKHK